MPQLTFFNCKYINKDLLEKIVPLIHHNPTLWFFNINHITGNDICTLDSIFSEYFMSNYKTTLYSNFLSFYPEVLQDQGIYKLSEQICLLNFINSLSKSFMKSKIEIIILNIIQTYDELITLLLSLQWPTVQFNNCLILKL